MPFPQPLTTRAAVTRSDTPVSRMTNPRKSQDTVSRRTIRPLPSKTSTKADTSRGSTRQGRVKPNHGAAAPPRANPGKPVLPLPNPSGPTPHTLPSTSSAKRPAPRVHDPLDPRAGFTVLILILILIIKIN
ncbi:hypothetical protein MFU01_37540 [Myxococcus fulvus]|uniref:Uncharacterized protein n=1 Tax=Myxococcus fulvus TaxID=33 RepID=A0A511T474_MYXFU|nr:hypothetical protein MFU01_37540 [Myxococcus fulvus]